MHHGANTLVSVKNSTIVNGFTRDHLEKMARCQHLISLLTFDAPSPVLYRGPGRSRSVEDRGRLLSRSVEDPRTKTFFQAEECRGVEKSRGVSSRGLDY